VVPVIAGPLTNASDAGHGKQLASRLCSNCHLIGDFEQQQANADVPSFQEIANKAGQSAGAIMGAHFIAQASDAGYSAHQVRAR
jgi:hypothetical protein